MTSVCRKEFLDLRVARTCATIWSISDPWATFTLMRLTQDGEVGRGRLGRVEGECRGDEAGGGGMPCFPEGPWKKKHLESGSALENQSWETCHVITSAGRQRKRSLGLNIVLDWSFSLLKKIYSIIALSICIYFYYYLVCFIFISFFSLSST